MRLSVVAPVVRAAWIAASLFSWTLAPGLSAQTPAPVVRAWLDTLSAAPSHRDVMKCRDFGIKEFTELHYIKGCMGKTADTVFVEYHTRSGRPLAFTMRFYVDRARFTSTVDSVKTEMSERFGPPVQCAPSVFQDEHWRLTQWYDGPFTIQVAVNDLRVDQRGFDDPRALPFVAVQVVAAVLPCGDWVEDPLSR